MGALAELVDLLKAKNSTQEAQERRQQRAEKRAKREEAAAKAGSSGTPSGNPNLDRFKSGLVDSGAKETELESPYPEKPAHWKAAEGVYGQHLFLGRSLRAMAYGKKYGIGTGPEVCPKVTRDVYKDKQLAKYMDECLAKDLSANNPTEGGYLVPEVTLNGVIEMLRERCVIFRLGAQELPMDNGTLRLNKQSDGATATYVGENQPVNASDPDFAGIKLSAKKMMINVPISNDLLKTSNIAADRFVANDAIKAAKVKFDRTAFNGLGTDDEPRGLVRMEGLTAVSLAGAVTADNLVGFLTKLFNANVDLDDFAAVAWSFGIEIWRDLFNAKATTNEYLLRDELKLGTLLRYKYEPTQFLKRLAGGTAPIYFGDWSQFIIARQGLMEVDTSTEAAYNNASGTVVSAWSRDQTLVRLIDRHDMGLRQATAIARCTDATTAVA